VAEGGHDKVKAPCPLQSPPPLTAPAGPPVSPPVPLPAKLTDGRWAFSLGSHPIETSPFAASALVALPELELELELSPPTGHLGSAVGFGSFQNFWDLDTMTLPEFKACKGSRQLSLQEWCSSPEREDRQARSMDIGPRPEATQSIELTPHGPPKLTSGAPLFTPPPPKKAASQGRTAGRSRSLSEVASRDVLSELLCCDESLGLSWDQGHDAKRSHWSGNKTLDLPDHPFDY
jgi:hypothetical protein